MDLANTTEGDTGYRVLGAGGAEPSPGGGHQTVHRAKKLFRVLQEGKLKAYTYTTIPVASKDQPCIVEFFRIDDQAVTCHHTVPWPPPDAAMAEAATAETAPGEPTQAEMAAAERIVEEEKKDAESEVEVLITLARNGKGKERACACRKAPKGSSKA